MITSSLKYCVAALLGLHTCAMADNHIFLHGSPMVTVKSKGVFEAFELSEYGDEGPPHVKPELKRAIRLLYSPGTSEGIVVEGFAIDPGIGCTEPDRVKLADSTPTDGVLSTRTLPSPKYPGFQSANPTQRREAMLALERGMRLANPS